jgi:hypothetical protein
MQPSPATITTSTLATSAHSSSQVLFLLILSRSKILKFLFSDTIFSTWDAVSQGNFSKRDVCTVFAVKYIHTP